MWHVSSPRSVLARRPPGPLYLQFFGGRTVARWQSVWVSGVDLVASYKQARLSGTLPDAQQAADLRQVGLAPPVQLLPQKHVNKAD